MRCFLILIFITSFTFAQSNSINLAGTDIELGMSAKEVWKLLNTNLKVSEDNDGNYYATDKANNPVGIVYFKDERVVKVIKDWGTTSRTNVGVVFKILWNIFRQYGEKTKIEEVLAQEIYTPTGEKFNLFFKIDNYRLLEINILRNVTIYEILEDPYSNY
jgi:hypothetical protein